VSTAAEFLSMTVSKARSRGWGPPAPRLALQLTMRLAPCAAGFNGAEGSAPDRNTDKHCHSKLG